MDYSLLRHLHVGAVLVTCGLFVLRGVWMLADSPRLGQRWARVLPHINDTVLLAAAIGMMWTGGLSLATNPWIVAKIGGLLVYIVLGSLALKRGRSKAARLGWFVAALAVFGYIVAVALTRQVLPGLT